MEIQWAKRVPQNLIRRLYENDAKNIQDNELADEVGYGLYVRAVDFIKVNRFHTTNIINCPSCGSDIHADAEKMYFCTCGWSVSKKEYYLSYKSTQYVGVSVVPFAEKFISDWERAKDNYSEKMRAIDYLIHSFHWELTENPTRPAAINFVEGRLHEIVELILELAYGNENAVYNEQLERWLRCAEKSTINDMVIEKKALIEKAL